MSKGTNTGNRNSGDYNSGGRNSGDCNSGGYNSGNYNSGFFNTNEPTVRLFNKETNLKRSELDIPYIYLSINEWISENNMTSEQKTNDKDFHIKGGTLIQRSYKEAWDKAWKDLSENVKNEFLNLPNFCSKIFEEITGINVNSTKKIIIDGKEIEISIESFEQLKKSLT